MAGLLTSSFEIPNNISAKIFKAAQSRSVVARLSGAEPQKFGKQTTWVLAAPPRAELVGEGGEKSPTPTEYTPKEITPIKAQVTMRFSEEVKYMDEDAQIGVLQDMVENGGIALSRALDLAAIHRINPLSGTVSSLVPYGLAQTTNSVTIANGKYDEAVEDAAGLIIAAGYTPTGVAFNPTMSYGIGKMRDTTGNKLYPEVGFGQNLTAFNGMAAAVGDTVSAKREAKTATNIEAIVGQWDAFRWGVQRTIGAKMIEYGDPDGLGDLQHLNQIAIRMEIIYGIGILAQDAFAKILKSA